MRNKGVIVLSKKMKKNDSLTYLNLGNISAMYNNIYEEYNKIQKEGAFELSEMLKTNCKLTYLNLCTAIICI